MFDKTVTIVLAGNTGKALQPLTADRAKAAVPFGGKYRVIDFTLTNCLHSGVRRILVLTQYKSHSLQKHIRDGWSVFNPEMGEYITTVPPQMRTGEGWYGGSADALHQNLYLLERSGAEHVMVLPGDHIYRMDYAPMMAFHQHHGANLTIACMESYPIMLLRMAPLPLKNNNVLRRSVWRETGWHRWGSTSFRHKNCCGYLSTTTTSVNRDMASSTTSSLR